MSTSPTAMPLTLVAVNLPNRARCLPDLFEVEGTHPLRRDPRDLNVDGVPLGRTFIYIQDTSEDAMKKLSKDTEALRVPKASAAECVSNLGLMELLPGDAIFARRKGDSADGTTDILQAMVLDRRVADELGRLVACRNGEELFNNFTAMRDEVLGDHADRTTDRAEWNNELGRFVGGTAFERAGNAHPVKTSRAYTIGVSYEKPTQLIAPSAGNKGSRLGDPSAGLAMRSRIMKAAMELATHATAFLPSAHCERMDMQADLVNAPRVGCDDNTSFSTAQLNISPAVAYSDGSTSLQSSLGFFGGAHNDSNDDLAGLSHMFAHADLPPGYDPGLFHLLELGVFVKLDGFKLMVFNGLRRHGGTVPRAPVGEPHVVPWAYRCVLVCYPSSAVVEGHGISAVASLRPSDQFKQKTGGSRYAKVKSKSVGAGAGRNVKRRRASGSVRARLENKEKGIFTMGMEIKNNPEDYAKQPWSSHATFAADGDVIMAPRSLVTYIARSLLLFCIYILAQLPQKYQVQIDTDKFLTSFSMEEDGERKNLEPWAYAPRLNDEAGGTARRLAAAKWNEYRERCKAFIPFAVTHNIRELEIDSGLRDPNRPLGGRPAEEAYVQSKKKHDDTEDADGEEGWSDIEDSGEDDGDVYDDVESEEVSGDGDVGNTEGTVGRASTKKKRASGPSARILRSAAAVSVTDRATLHVAADATARASLAHATGAPSSVTLGKRRAQDNEIDMESPRQATRLRSRSPDDFTVDQFDDSVLAPPLAAEFMSAIFAAAPPGSAAVPCPATTTFINPWRNPLNLTVDECNINALWACSAPIRARDPFPAKALYDDTESTLRAYEVIFAQKISTSPTHAVQQLATLQAQFSSEDWSGPQAISSAMSAWDSMKTLAFCESKTTLETRHNRYQLLLNHASLWAWLETLCWHLSHPDTHSSSNVQGVARLASRVSLAIELRRSGDPIIPSDYHASFPSHPYSLPFTDRERFPVQMTAFQKQRILYNKLVEVLTFFLGFPTEFASRPRAWLLAGLIELRGLNILLASSTYELYQRFPALILGLRQLRKAVDPIDIVPALLALSHHPILLNGTHEAQFLALLGKMNDAFGRGRLLPLAQSDLAVLELPRAAYLFQELSPSSNTAAGPARAIQPPSGPSDDHMSTPSSPLHPHLPLAFGNSTPASLAPITPPQTSPALLPPFIPEGADARIVHVVHILRILEPLIDGPTHHSQSTLNLVYKDGYDQRLADKVSCDLDKFLPFREHGPSRRRSREEGGAFSGKLVQTAAGLFNGLVFRTMQFGSQLLFERHPWYANAEELLHQYHAILESHPPTTKSYFVNNSIYGPGNNRTMLDAPALWNAVQSRALPFASKGRAAFLPFWKALKAKDGNNKRIYRQCGPLIGLLLAADYVYADVVEMPSVVEMAKVIHANKKGSYHGLYLLGLLLELDGEPTVAMVVSAFQYFYYSVSAELTDAEIKHMVWDAIMAEHVLCKVERLYNQGYIDF
ncbi:hypothetical protein BV25DRAFT_1917696 [Artomyces pyxidatus]|uniref:Uncharacterized protein n=1 Tax=Artomyces pyxidatus TaxID=48021 RepID=A0ACB8SWW2_9AGAM|nr:hypothetical protein BV25DRAFT_1917696 [Artomyces pyxidatus]